MTRRLKTLALGLMAATIGGCGRGDLATPELTARPAAAPTMSATVETPQRSSESPDAAGPPSGSSPLAASAESAQASITLKQRPRNDADVSRLVNIFQPPRDPLPPPEPVKEEPVPEAAPVPADEVPPTPLPKLRLLGFVHVDSNQAVLLVDDQIAIVAEGTKLRELEIIQVAEPTVKLKPVYEDREITLNLMEQLPQHEAASGARLTGTSGRNESGVGTSRNATRRMPPTRPTSAEASWVPPSAGPPDTRLTGTAAPSPPVVPQLSLPGAAPPLPTLPALSPMPTATGL